MRGAPEDGVDAWTKRVVREERERGVRGESVSNAADAGLE